jgi:hypothetical protein
VKETTTVRVTEKHIRAGKPCKSCECPLALAVIDALVAQGIAVITVEVDMFDVTALVDESGQVRKFRADLDTRSVGFVEAFDDEDEEGRDAEVVAPFETELTWCLIEWREAA